MSDSKVTIKTAQVTFFTVDGFMMPITPGIGQFDAGYTFPNCVVSYGLTESEVHEAANLLAKSREVCEWARDTKLTSNPDTYMYKTACGESLAWYSGNGKNARPCWCGRRVVVKEG